MPKAANPAVAKAAATSRKLRLGSHGKTIRVRTNSTFYRPKTLELARAPKYPRKSAPGLNKMDKYRIVKSPLTTESAMLKMEHHNTLTFIVDLKANKRQIKAAVKSLYDVDVQKVNTLIRYALFLIEFCLCLNYFTARTVRRRPTCACTQTPMLLRSPTASTSSKLVTLSGKYIGSISSNFWLLAAA